MGDGAKQNLDSLGIGIVSGAKGNVEEVVQQYIEGTLKVSEGGCHSDHHGSNHHCNCHKH
jgi:predicted Fe-Mo cluster-binding NifX family protein